MLVEPEEGGDFVFAGVLMAAMRGACDAPLIGLNFVDGGGEVADSTVEVVCGAEENDGAFDEFQAVIVANGGTEYHAVIVSIADATTGGGGGFDAWVDAGHDGKFAAH